jgi:hypothetical protein
MGQAQEANLGLSRLPPQTEWSRCISERASLPVHLVSKEPKGHLDVCEPGHMQNVGEHRPSVTPRSRSPLYFCR